MADPRRSDRGRSTASELALRWLDELPTAVFVVDASGTPVYANSASFELLGKGVMEVGPERLAETYQAYVAGTDHEYPVERMPIVRALSGETSTVEDIEIRHPDRAISLEVRGAPVRDSEGEISFAIAVFTDVTERKELHAVLEEQAEMLDLVEDAVNAVDMDHRITYWNRTAESMYGWTREEAIGAISHELLSTSFPVPLTAIFSELSERGRWEGELLQHAKDGSEVVVASRWALRRDGDGQPHQILKVNNDISARKRAEEVLEQARDAADKANLAKSEFLSRMSHELRTPLNAILGFAQLLEMEELDPAQRESTGQIVKGGRHLLQLINEVLDIARIESGRLTLSIEPVVVCDVIRECVGLIRPLGEERRIPIHFECPPELRDQHVRSDRQRLGQVLLNLLSNAVKYNASEGTVTVTCLMADDGKVRVGVTDTGPGIPPDKVPLLFTPFERLGAEATSEEGAGLGLALSKSLVEAMDGRMVADSMMGKGTTFWVELRAAEAPGAATTDEIEDASPRQYGRTSRVLYIEDNLSNLKLIERLLERRAEVELISAMTGALGTDLARQHAPDLILLDLDLPDIRGDRVLSRLRRDPRTAGIPVVILSADATPGEIKRLLAAGAADYLTKPIEVPAFLRIVDDILTRSEDG